MAAATKDTRNKANLFYAGEAVAQWAFNGSGTFNPVAPFVWAANAAAGVTPPAAGWQATGAIPTTTTERANDAILGQTWSPTPP